MKTNVFKIAAMMLLLAGGLISCREKNEDEKPPYLIFESSCENKTILETFENEHGFLRVATDPIADIIFYYYFEPITSRKEFSERLLFWYHSGFHGDADANLEKYANEIITVSGNVTNCLYQIRRIFESKESVTVEYNMLELSSISIK